VINLFGVEFRRRLTHGHFDHVGETIQIANRTHARLVATFDLAEAMVKVAKFPAAQTGFDVMGNPGGEITVADGEVKITFVQAIHSSSLEVPDGDKTGAPAVYGGVAVGYVIQIKNGPTIYDSGDTAYFSDIKLIGAKFHPDLAILNIGGHFGMEVPDALQAAKDVGATKRSRHLHSVDTSDERRS
jgi:L-ascorbate metabolism protein UlaG (beta-lactamase superfamily)